MFPCSKNRREEKYVKLIGEKISLHHTTITHLENGVFLSRLFFVLRCTCGTLSLICSSICSRIVGRPPEIFVELLLKTVVGSSLHCIATNVGVINPWLPLDRLTTANLKKNYNLISRKKYLVVILSSLKKNMTLYWFYEKKTGTMEKNQLPVGSAWNHSI